MTSRCVIYRRQSLDRAGDELGIERQLKECQRLAAARGYDVIDVVTDNSLTASKRGRPGYARVVDLMKASQVDVVLILRIDRLLRLNDELEELIRLTEGTSVKLVTVEGDIDISTPQGRLMARVLVSVARNEMEVKSARHKLANQQKAQAGKPHGGRRPYGYEPDFVTICTSEAAVLCTMADRLIAGHSYKHIAYWLNEQGQRTTTGKPWYPITVRNLLAKKRYAGLREYHGEEYPAVWPAIFDSVTWERLQLAIRLRSDEANPPAVRPRKYLLTGLVRCGKCGNPLNGELRIDHPGKPKRRIYFCRTQGDDRPERGCGGVRRNADALDDFVAACVLYRLDSPALAELVTHGGDDGQWRELLRRRDAAKLRLDALVDDYASGLLDRPQFSRAKRVAKTALDHAETALDAFRGQQVALTVPAGQTLRAAWQRAETEWQRQLLELLIEHIVVRPGTSKPPYQLADGRTARFDPGLIEIHWRK